MYRNKCMYVLYAGTNEPKSAQQAIYCIYIYIYTHII